jgi:hypothetical protein
LSQMFQPRDDESEGTMRRQKNTFAVQVNGETVHECTLADAAWRVAHVRGARRTGPNPNERRALRGRLRLRGGVERSGSMTWILGTVALGLFVSMVLVLRRYQMVAGRLDRALAENRRLRAKLMEEEDGPDIPRWIRHPDTDGMPLRKPRRISE